MAESAVQPGFKRQLLELSKMVTVSVAVLIWEHPARMRGVLFVGPPGFKHIEEFASQRDVTSLVRFDRECFWFTALRHPSFGVNVVCAFGPIDVSPLCNRALL